MVTVEEVKQFLNIEVNDQDVFIGNLIQMAISRMNNICNRELIYSERTDIRDGLGQAVFFLKNYPVEVIDSINFREEKEGFDKPLFGEKTPAGNLYLVKRSGKVILLNGFYLPRGIANVEINYSCLLYTSPSPRDS